MRTSVRYSQNFLRPSTFLKGLVLNSSITPEDLVLDIGAGTGVLCALLAERARTVIAIETDTRLTQELRQRFAATPNVVVVSGDFTTQPLPDEPYKVFANIPFNRTSEIVHKLLGAPQPPLDSYLMMQREAAEKFTGLNGRQSLFSILHAPWFEMAVVYRFRRSDFTPEPGVDVVLLRCRPWPHPAKTVTHRGQYEDFVSYTFNHANPTVLPALQKLFDKQHFDAIARSLGPNIMAKPTALPLAVWLSLYQTFHQSANNRQKRLIEGTAMRLRTESSRIEKYHRTRLSKHWRSEAQT